MTKRWLRPNCWPILNFQQGPPFSCVGTFYFARKSRSWINKRNNKALLTFKGWLLSHSSLKTRKENMGSLNKEGTRKENTSCFVIKKTPRKELPLERKHTKWICGKLKVNQGSAFPSETPPSSDRPQQSPFENSSSFSKSVRNRETCQKRRFRCCCASWQCVRLTRGEKNSIFANLRDLLQICTVAHWTSPSHHLFRMEAKNDDRSSSFAEKSGGSALRNQGLHSRKFTLPCQPGAITARDQLDRHFFTLFSHSFKWILCKWTQRTSPQTKILLMLYKL